MTTVLMVITAADSITLADGTDHPTGYWAEEVAASHRVLREAGVSVDIATPAGRKPTVDAISLDERGGVSDVDAKEFRQYLDSIGELRRPLALADVVAGDYDAIYIPGGHGPMADLSRDADLGRLLVKADADGQLIAALCHGPAALLSATRDDGTFVFTDRRLTTFTDEEERQGGLGANTPYLVESSLRDRGVVVEAGPAWTSTVVVDGNLITGQNPQSSVDTAKHVIEALQRQASR